MEHNEQVILQERVWAWPIDDARSTCDEWVCWAEGKQKEK
jgi:hypothetical protein